MIRWSHAGASSLPLSGCSSDRSGIADHGATSMQIVRLVPARVKQSRTDQAPSSAPNSVSVGAPTWRTVTMRCGRGRSMPSRSNAFLIAAR